MFINENYEFPSQLHDSSQQEFDFNKIQYLKQPIQARNEYQLEGSYIDHSDDLQRSAGQQKQLQIDHSLDNSSFENDKFLEMIQKQNLQNKSSKVTKALMNNDPKHYLMVDKNKIEMTLLRTQTSQQVISFRNPTSSAMKIKFSECSFQIESIKTLSYVLADQIQIILQAWERIEVNFLIKQNQEEYGDIIQNIIVISQFIDNRNEVIAPVQIKFNIHFVIPKLKLKFQGKYQIINIQPNKMAVIKLEPNQMAQYCINIALMEGLNKCKLNIETRGKITSLSDTITIREGDYTDLKIRTRFINNADKKQKSVIICKPQNTKICYMFGLQFLH